MARISPAKRERLRREGEEAVRMQRAMIAEGRVCATCAHCSPYPTDPKQLTCDLGSDSDGYAMVRRPNEVTCLRHQPVAGFSARPAAALAPPAPGASDALYERDARLRARIQRSGGVERAAPGLVREFRTNLDAITEANRAAERAKRERA